MQILFKSLSTLLIIQLYLSCTLLIIQSRLTPCYYTASGWIHNRFFRHLDSGIIWMFPCQHLVQQLNNYNAFRNVEAHIERKSQHNTLIKTEKRNIELKKIESKKRDKKSWYKTAHMCALPPWQFVVFQRSSNYKVIQQNWSVYS